MSIQVADEFTIRNNSGKTIKPKPEVKKERRTNNRTTGTGGLKANLPPLKVRSQVPPKNPELEPAMEYSQAFPNENTSTMDNMYSAANMDKGISKNAKPSNPGDLMKGARRKKVGKGSYQRGKTAPKTKMVTAPGRNPTNKKVRVIDRPSKRKKQKNTSGSARFAGGGLVASLYESF